MGAITKQYAQQQLNKYLRQKKSLDKINPTVDQRKQLTAFYDREIALWQGWVNTFEEIDGPVANTLTVEFEQL